MSPGVHVACLTSSRHLLQCLPPQTEQTRALTGGTAAEQASSYPGPRPASPRPVSGHCIPVNTSLKYRVILNTASGGTRLLSRRHAHTPQLLAMTAWCPHVRGREQTRTLGLPGALSGAAPAEQVAGGDPVACGVFSGLSPPWGCKSEICRGPQGTVSPQVLFGNWQRMSEDSGVQQ